MSTTVIRPSGRFPSLRFRELIHSRDLFLLLVWRNIRLRYKQTVLGAAWAVIQPLALMAVFAVFFGHLAKVSSGGRYPYPVFAYSGLVPWTLFFQGASAGAESLVGSASVITKVYFPRLLVPLAAATSYLLDAIIALVLLVGLMAFYGVEPHPSVAALPLLVLLAYVVAVACSIWLSALNVRYRDVRYVLPLIFQVWMFATPIVYSVNVVPERWRTLYSLNPMVGVVDLCRAALFGTPAGSPGSLAVAAISTVVLFLTGLAYFRATERSFADVV